MGYKENVIHVEHQHGVWCDIHEDTTWWISRMTPEAISLLGTPAKCNSKCDGVFVEYEKDQEYYSEEYICSCGSHNAQIRYVWGLFYDYACDSCWAKTPTAETEWRQYDYLYAGEYYDDPDYGEDY